MRNLTNRIVYKGNPSADKIRNTGDNFREAGTGDRYFRSAGSGYFFERCQRGPGMLKKSQRVAGNHPRINPSSAGSRINFLPTAP